VDVCLKRDDFERLRMPLRYCDIQTKKGTFFFDPADRIYGEHFPGHPVVPGSLIVCAFMAAARSLMTAEPAWSMENFRFRRFIIPGEYLYEIEVLQDRLWCTLYDGESVVLTGTLKI
jgi:3-hydroxyacyl-[acyl-carrier-protein] dehydratase